MSASTPLPECNFCGSQYDPYDIHTCSGNQIYPKFKRTLPKEQPGIRKYEHPCGLEISINNPGLTRQQIGETLDADRLASSVGESALDELRALSSQVGGDHYRKMKIQPVEYIIANHIGFLPGNIIKYASRYPDKGGAEDIRKIIHYCKLILEFEYGERNGG